MFLFDNIFYSDTYNRVKLSKNISSRNVNVKYHFKTSDYIMSMDHFCSYSEFTLKRKYNVVHIFIIALRWQILKTTGLLLLPGIATLRSGVTPGIQIWVGQCWWGWTGMCKGDRVQTIELDRILMFRKLPKTHRGCRSYWNTDYKWRKSDLLLTKCWWNRINLILIKE